MAKLIFGIFAHPDDESFGPSGTLIKEINENGTSVHLISLTAGERGSNPDNLADLGAARLKEWQKATELIGAESHHYLGYPDGGLCNDQYLAIAKKIFKIIDKIIANHPNSTDIEFMTSDLNGISGHIDHIVAARIACYVFYTYKFRDARFTRIRLACQPIAHLPHDNISWLYMEAGRSESEIDETVDAREYSKKIEKVMRTHHTQRQDCESHLSRRGKNLGIEYFLVKT
ncbi:MAG: PIG-L deacetylase family protein [Candidatus Saccharimonas sp.]